MRGGGGGIPTRRRHWRPTRWRRSRAGRGRSAASPASPRGAAASPRRRPARSRSARTPCISTAENRLARELQGRPAARRRCLRGDEGQPGFRHRRGLGRREDGPEAVRVPVVRRVVQARPPVRRIEHHDLRTRKGREHHSVVRFQSMASNCRLQPPIRYGVREAHIGAGVEQPANAVRLPVHRREHQRRLRQIEGRRCQDGSCNNRGEGKYV